MVLELGFTPKAGSAPGAAELEPLSTCNAPVVDALLLLVGVSDNVNCPEGEVQVRYCFEPKHVAR